MARYEHLPIYKKAMVLTVYFEKIVRKFSRYNKNRATLYLTFWNWINYKKSAKKTGQD